MQGHHKGLIGVAVAGVAGYLLFIRKPKAASTTAEGVASAVEKVSGNTDVAVDRITDATLGPGEGYEGPSLAEEGAHV